MPLSVKKEIIIPCLGERNVGRSQAPIQMEKSAQDGWEELDASSEKFNGIANDRRYHVH